MNHTQCSLHSWPARGFAMVVFLRAISAAHAGPASGDDAGAGAAASVSVPQEDVMSSLKQAFQQDFDHQVVRGRFDVGSPPDPVHRYYCLVDAKTGKTQPNGVAGEPYPRTDGMTGIKGTAVSLYSCASAARLGLLETTEFVLTGAAARAIESRPTVAAATPPVSPAATGHSAPPASGAPATPRGADFAADGVDVAGVRLGMSLDAARLALQSRKLVDYREGTLTLGHPEVSGATTAPSDTRFVNVVAAWTAPVDGEGEAYEIMFTPVPGRERVMAIVHSVSYSTAHAVRESALEAGLVKKYGVASTADGFPAAPTWEVQTTGEVRAGDSCKRRGLFGGLAAVGPGDMTRPNFALQTTPYEFRHQIDECGVAIVTEDHLTAPGGGSREERPVTRFTVTAYSPSIGLEGATAAAQAMLMGQPEAVRESGAVRGREPVPDL